MSEPETVVVLDALTVYLTTIQIYHLYPVEYERPKYIDLYTYYSGAISGAGLLSAF